MFMMPFYNLTNPHISRKLIEYRIKTLPGAISKAKEFGYQGAFYAWESQEDGLERCSKYNVTDPQTGEPIRTYFNEKQIHIDGAIVHAIDQYVLTTGDISILSDGGLSIIKECAKFYMSYSKKESDGLYHLNDVIGPDEYHERINDDAYTNYMAVETYKKAKKYLPIEDSMIPLLDDYVNHSYLPLPNEEGIIEQFNGYFELEDAYPNNLLSRLRFPNEYWGGENGVATKTKVIKQADVVALLSTLDIFNADIEKKNYDYYEPHTEHGSSLSSSMHSILASKLGYLDKAYEMFISSALIDIKGAKKQWAGGIYIGGTHPASNGGAYMSVVYGFLGMKINEEGLIFNPHLPKQIKEIKLVYKYKGKQYLLICNKKGLTTEEINHV